MAPLNFDPYHDLIMIKEGFNLYIVLSFFKLGQQSPLIHCLLISYAAHAFILASLPQP